MDAMDPRLIVRLDVDAEALGETLTTLADVAQQLADVLILARDLLDETQAAITAAAEAEQ